MAVRFAVVGAGVMGADHARIVARELRGAVLQVVCDTCKPAARKAADSHGALDATTDPSATISRKDVDAVIIASPDRTHAALTKECIGKGKKVLCEKPLSQSSRECLDVMAEEQRAGERRVQIGFMRRYDQSYVEMKDALDQRHDRAGARHAQFPQERRDAFCRVHRLNGDFQFRRARVRYRSIRARHRIHVNCCVAAGPGPTKWWPRSS